MKRAASILLVLFLLLGQLTFVSVAAEDSPTPLSDFSYTLDPETKTVTLRKYIGAGGSVTVDGSYTVEDVVYTTLLDTSSVFIGNTAITSVVIRGGAGVVNQTAAYLFGKCSNLVSADLTGLNTTGVTSLRCMFAYCSALETVDVTGLDTGCVTDMMGLFGECRKLNTIIGYENWNTGSVDNIYMAFNQTRALKKVDLGNWDLGKVANSGWCFQYCGAAQILLPDNLKTISAGFFNHAKNVQGATFTVPAGVEKIGYAHTFYDFGTGDFTEFTVAETNPHYTAIDGILYSADGKELLAVPRAKTFADGVCEIPEGVTFLGELCFSRNYNIKTLILPDSLDINFIELGDPDYIVFADDGNLNAGSNLNIAIYCYTGITAYGVKASNPNYTSRDGILYTKDMSAVVAIPSRYDRYIQIPEGVTDWGKDTLWTVDDSSVKMMANCTGVSIPASLVSISQDQIQKLNSLNRIFDSFSISVSEENPVYCIDENGDLILRPAPPETTPEQTVPQETAPTETLSPETEPTTVPSESVPPVTEPSTAPPPETLPPQTVPEETTPPPSGVTDVMPPETFPMETYPPNPSVPETTEPEATEPAPDRINPSFASFLRAPLIAVILGAVIRVAMRKKQNKL